MTGLSGRQKVPLAARPGTNSADSCRKIVAEIMLDNFRDNRVTGVMSSINQLTSSQLRKAASLKEKIAKLEKELAGIVGGSGPAPKAAAAKPAKKKRKMSAAGRARIAAAQKARWAKIKAAKK